MAQATEHSLSVSKKQHCRGQSIIESCIAIGLICVMFIGVLQVSQMYAAREVLHHTAARGARAKTVGFSWWMVRKAIRVASIPNAGRLIEPAFDNEDPALRSLMQKNPHPGDLWTAALGVTPASLQFNLERALIPEYMYAAYRERANYVLNYEGWDRIHADHGESAIIDGAISAAPEVTIKVWQSYTNWLNLPRTFYSGDSVSLHAEYSMENHSSVYLDDQLW
jgi:hypothetical protein